MSLLVFDKVVNVVVDVRVGWVVISDVDVLKVPKLDVVLIDGEDVMVLVVVRVDSVVVFTVGVRNVVVPMVLLAAAVVVLLEVVSLVLVSVVLAVFVVAVVVAAVVPAAPAVSEFARRLLVRSELSSRSLLPVFRSALAAEARSAASFSDWLLVLALVVWVSCVVKLEPAY